MENKGYNQDIDIDNIIHKLLEICGPKNCRDSNLSESDIIGIAMKSREIFASQPILLELEVPIKICGMFFVDQYI